MIAARDNPDDKSALKCMALGTEKALKYKQKPQELLEYNTQLDSCTNKFSEDWFIAVYHVFRFQNIET